MSSHGTLSTRRVPALDGVRGIAILWVVLHNAMDIPVAPASGLWRLVNLLVHPGWIGVQLFFALSGFLITTGLLETRGTYGYFRNFYVRRALRILPLYYAVLILLLVIAPNLPGLPWQFTTRGQASLWLFTVNWTHDAPYGFAHFWSLAVEEQFYLLWPFVVWKLAPRQLFWCCIGISLVALILRAAMVAHGADPWTLYINTACRMDALALGAAAACVVAMSHWREWVRTHARRILLWSAVLFAAGIPLTRMYDRYGVAGETLGYTILALCSAALVLCVSLGGSADRVGAALEWAPLRSLGKYSYAIYVFHGLLNKLVGEPWLNAHFGQHPSTQMALLYAFGLLAVSYVLAVCSYHLLEKHFLKLKKLFVPAPQAAAF